MLILIRRVGDTLMIGDDVAATLHAIERQQIRVEINAPKTIPVHREAIYQKIQQEAANQDGQPPSSLAGLSRHCRLATFDKRRLSG